MLQAHTDRFLFFLECMLVIQLFVYKYNKVYFKTCYCVILGDLAFSVKSSKETSSCPPDSTTDTSSRSSGQTAKRPTCTQIHTHTDNSHWIISHSTHDRYQPCFTEIVILD